MPSDMRHNPDLDEAMGFGPPKAPEPAAPPPSPTSVVMLAAEINRLVAVVGSLSTSKPFQQQQGKGQQQAAPRPPSNAPLIAALTVLTGSVNRLNATMQKSGGGQSQRQAQQQKAAKRRAKKPARPNWFMRRLYANSGQNPAGRAGRFLHKFSGKKGVAGTGAGKFAGAAGGVLMVAGALGEMHKQIKETTARLIEQNKQYEHASGAMAAVMAEREIRELQRDQKKGDALAPSARKLVESEQNRKDSTANIEVLFGNLQNTFMSVINNAVAEVMKPLNWIAGKLGFKVDDNEVMTAADVLDSIKEDYEAARARRDQWFTRRPM